jgi:DUF971 family protein
MALKRIPIPLEVVLEDEGRSVRVVWEGGRVSSFSAFELRAQCPCAVCVDEMTGERILKREEIDPGVAAVSFARVGRYALQFQWSDGHATGIYAYERLYQEST